MDEQQNIVKEDIAALLNQIVASCHFKLWTITIWNLWDIKRVQDTLKRQGQITSESITYSRSEYDSGHVDQIDTLVFELQSKLDRIISWGQQSFMIGYDRHVHKFIRTAIEAWIKTVFSRAYANPRTKLFRQPMGI